MCKQILSILIVLLINIPAFANEWVESTGEAVGRLSWDVLQEAAQKKALQKALASRVKQELSLTIFRKNARSIERELFPQMDRFLLESELISSYRRGSTFFAKIRAQFDQSAIKVALRELGLLSAWKETNSVLAYSIQGNEGNYAYKAGFGPLANQAISELEKAGFDVRKLDYPSKQSLIALGSITSSEQFFEAVTASDIEGLPHLQWISSSEESDQAKWLVQSVHLERFRLLEKSSDQRIIGAEWSEALRSFGLTDEGASLGLTTSTNVGLVFKELGAQLQGVSERAFGQYRKKVIIYARDYTHAWEIAKDLRTAKGVESLRPVVLEQKDQPQLMCEFFSEKESAELLASLRSTVPTLSVEVLEHDDGHTYAIYSD